MSRDFERLRTCKAGFECNVDKVNQNSRTAVVSKFPLNCWLIKRCNFQVSILVIAYNILTIVMCIRFQVKHEKIQVWSTNLIYYLIIFLTGVLKVRIYVLLASPIVNRRRTFCSKSWGWAIDKWILHCTGSRNTWRPGRSSASSWRGGRRWGFPRACVSSTKCWYIRKHNRNC